MGINGYDIFQIANSVLESMEIERDYGWDQWWTQFAGGDVPNEGTKADFIYKRARIDVKDAVNDEFKTREISNRIVCTRQNGVRMLDGLTRVADWIMLERVKRIFGALDLAQNELGILSGATGIDETDKRMLNRVVAGVETQKSVFAGTYVRMRSLPPDVKRALLAEINVDI